MGSKSQRLLIDQVMGRLILRLRLGLSFKPGFDARLRQQLYKRFPSDWSTGCSLLPNSIRPHKPMRRRSQGSRPRASGRQKPSSTGFRSQTPKPAAIYMPCSRLRSRGRISRRAEWRSSKSGRQISDRDPRRRLPVPNCNDGNTVGPHEVNGEARRSADRLVPDLSCELHRPPRGIDPRGRSGRLAGRHADHRAT
jgi:hypothetical protein